MERGVIRALVASVCVWSCGSDGSSGSGDADASDAKGGVEAGLGGGSASDGGNAADATTLTDSGGGCEAAGCTQPPGPVCVDAQKLRTFASPGTCGANGCDYASSDGECAHGCENGACKSCSLGAWTLESIPGVAGSGWLGVDGAQVVHLTHSESPAYGLSYRTRAPGGSWEPKAAPPSGSIVFPYLHVDAFGSVHLPHEPSLGAPTDLIHSRLKPGGSWENQAVGASAGVSLSNYGTSIVVDSQEAVHMLINDGHGTSSATRIRYAKRPEGGQWSVATLDTYPETSSVSIALAIDSTDGLHAIYDLNASGIVRYAHLPLGGQWSKQDLGASPTTAVAAARVGIAVDPGSGVHAIYSERASKDVHYAHRPKDGTFTNETLSTGNSFVANTRIAVGSDGSVHALYGVMSTGTSRVRLHYDTKAPGGSWATSFLDDTASYNTGTSVSLTLDATGAVHAAYSKLPVGQIKGELKYAVRVCE